MKTMSQFIRNMNEYLDAMKIKQSFISLKTGIDSSKLSRILTSVQDITSSDMEKLAQALGKKVEYFLTENFKVEPDADDMGTEVVFYAGEPGEEQGQFARKVIDLIRNVDEIVGAEPRMLKAAKGQMDGI